MSFGTSRVVLSCALKFSDNVPDDRAGASKFSIKKRPIPRFGPSVCSSTVSVSKLNGGPFDSTPTILFDYRNKSFGSQYCPGCCTTASKPLIGFDYIVSIGKRIPVKAKRLRLRPMIFYSTAVWIIWRVPRLTSTVPWRPFLVVLLTSYSLKSINHQTCGKRVCNSKLLNCF